MSYSAQNEALLRCDENDVPVAALYTAWRLHGRTLFAFKHALAQLSMGFVVALLYIVAVGLNVRETKARLTSSFCEGLNANNASLMERDCHGNQPIDVFRTPPFAVVLTMILITLAMLTEFVLFLVTMQTIRVADAWWDTLPQPQPHYTTLDWNTIHWRFVDNVRTVTVTARSQFFHRLYNHTLRDFDECSRSLHVCVNVAVRVHLATNIPLKYVFYAEAVLSMMAAPYIIIAIFCHHIFKHFYVLRTSGVGSVFGRRKMSLLCKWRHHGLTDFTKRDVEIARVERLASDIYEGLPPSMAARIAANAFLVCGGAFTALMLILTFVFDEHFLTAELAFGRSNAFYVACVGVATAMVSNTAKWTEQLDEDHRNFHLLTAMGEQYMMFSHDENVANLTKWFPREAWTFAVEVASLVTTPVLLTTTLASRAGAVQAAVNTYFRVT